MNIDSVNLPSTFIIDLANDRNGFKILKSKDNMMIDKQWNLFFVGSGMGDRLTSLVNLLKSSPNRDLAQEFMAASKLDFKAARILNKNEINSLATFHLQQGVEKLCKALFLFDNRKTVSERTLNNHNSLKIIEDWTFDNQKIKRPSVHPVSKILSNEKGLLRSPSAVIRGLLLQSVLYLFKGTSYGNSITDLFKHEGSTNRSILSEKEKEITKEVASFDEQKIKRLFTEIKQSEEHTKKSAVSFNSGYSEEQFKFLDSVIDLLGLAFLTFPHENSTRYPTSAVDINCKEYDNEKIGLVKCFDLLINIADFAGKEISKTLL